MIPFVALHAGSFTFVQKSIWHRRYELMEGEKTVGTLSFRRLLSDQTDVECVEGHWVFNTKGVFNPVAIISPPDAKKPLATISLKQSRGMFALKLPRYRTLRLTTNIWKSEYVLKTTMNATLCTLKIRQFPKFGGDLTVERDAEFLREYPWLTYLVAYVALLNQRRHS